MEICPLDIKDHAAWAQLLAVCFDRTCEQMQALLAWYERMGMIAYGAWDGSRLVGQYAVLKRRLQIPSETMPQLVGLSLNMAIHPDYRGRGLVKQMSAPTYTQLAAEGGIAGVGFSSAEEVKVDRNSKGYGYSVVGQMPSWIAVPPTRKYRSSRIKETHQDLVRFRWETETLAYRYNAHPFRQYQTVVDGKNSLVFRDIGRYGVSLLGAYGQDFEEILQRWWCSLHPQGRYYVHFLSTPNAQLLQDMRITSLVLPMPVTRNPQYLTVKPLNENYSLLDFQQWDCTGGDVL